MTDPRASDLASAAPVAGTSPGVGAAAQPHWALSVFRFFASLKLALILLAVLIIALAIGTTVESKESATLARALIYDAPWFSIWLAFLIINLTCAALIRFPWKPHLTGFVITHLGIITMLVGGKVGQVGGIEGVVGLHVGEPGKTAINLTERQWIEVGLPERHAIYQLPFQLDVDSVSAESPRKYTVADTGVSVAVEQIRPVFENTRVLPADEGPGALNFVFSSQRMQQSVDEWLSVGESSDKEGIIDFRFMRGTPPVVNQPAVVPAVGVPDGSAAVQKVPSVDAFYLFQTGSMKVPQKGASVGPESGATGAFTYVDATDAGGKESAKLHLEVAGQVFDLDAREVEGKAVPLPNTPYTLELQKVYRNLHVMTGGGASDGDGPAKNPAVLIRLSGPLVDPTAKVEGAPNDPHGGGGASGGGGMGAPPMLGGPRNQIVFFLAPDGTLAYWGKSPTKGEQSGRLTLNRPVALGWADMQIVVKTLYPHARRLTYFVPAQDGEFDPDSMDLYRKGVLCNITYNGASQRLWLGQQSPDADSCSSLLFGDKTLNLQFTNQTVDLGFPVALKSFDVPMNPGTTTPMDWKSTLEIGPPENAETATIFMNHPANYPNTALGAYTGTSFKFSQADADPSRPNYSGVQVLRDPGWSGKWLGALLICFGIFTMFYLKPYVHGRKMMLKERQRAQREAAAGIDPAMQAARSAEAAKAILARAKGGKKS